MVYKDMIEYLSEGSEGKRSTPRETLLKLVSALNSYLEPRGCRIVYLNRLEGLRIQFYHPTLKKWVDKVAFGGSYDLLIYQLGVLYTVVVHLVEGLPERFLSE